MYRFLYRTKLVFAPNLLVALLLGFLLGIATVSRPSLELLLLNCPNNKSSTATATSSIGHFGRKISLNVDNLAEFYEEYYKFYELSQAW